MWKIYWLLKVLFYVNCKKLMVWIKLIWFRWLNHLRNLYWCSNFFLFWVTNFLWNLGKLKFGQQPTFPFIYLFFKKMVKTTPLHSFVVVPNIQYLINCYGQPKHQTSTETEYRTLWSFISKGNKLFINEVSDHHTIHHIFFFIYS